MCSTYAVGSTVEKPAETQTSIALASHLARVRNFLSGGREFVFPAMIKFGALTESGKILGARSSYSGDPDVIMSRLTCSKKSVWLHNARSLACHWQTHLQQTILLY
jgi:hypothetical protein